VKKTLELLNSLVTDKVIEGYAIGGAVASIFHTEPSETADLDVFITFPQDRVIVSLDDIYSHLKTLGYDSFDKEGVVIEGIPVQFLPTAKPLLHDAFLEAKDEKIAGTIAKVMTLEHLAAIMLDTSRPKDKIRLAAVWDEPKLDKNKFFAIVDKHGLRPKWEIFHERNISPDA